MKILYISILSCFFLGAFAQNPELVVDFSPGPLDTEGSDGFQAAGNNFIAFSATSADHGDEPFALKNGELILLKDIIDGYEGSYTNNYTTYNGKVYFVDTEYNVGVDIYVTDGTPEGTKILKHFDYMTDAFFGRFLVTSINELYFTFDKSLYKVTDETVEFVIDNVDFAIDTYQGEVMCRYGNYFAFLREKGYSELELVVYDGSDLIVLATKPYGVFGSFKYGLTQVEGGFLFAIDEGGEVSDGYFRYNHITGQITQVCPSPENIFPTYTYNLNNELQINYMGGDKGWITNDATSDDLITDLSEFGDISSFLHRTNIVHKDKLAFIGEKGLFETNYNITDGTIANTEVLFELEFGEPTAAFSYNDYVFLATTSLSNTTSHIYYADFTKNEGGKLLEIPNSNNISLVGIHNETLYFFGELDSEIGIELYKVNVDLPNLTSTKEQEAEDTYSTIFNTNNSTVQITSNNTEKIHIKIYNINGELLQKSNGVTNSPISFENHTGIMIFTFETEEGKIFTEKYFSR